MEERLQKVISRIQSRFGKRKILDDIEILLLTETGRAICKENPGIDDKELVNKIVYDCKDFLPMESYTKPLDGNRTSAPDETNNDDENRESRIENMIGLVEPIIPKYALLDRIDNAFRATKGAFYQSIKENEIQMLDNYTPLGKFMQIRRAILERNLSLNKISPRHWEK
jgi:hypothetical protein